jgi:hypothetical protein
MFSANDKEEDSDAKVDLHNDAPASAACAVAGGLWRWHNRRADHRSGGDVARIVEPEHDA